MRMTSMDLSASERLFEISAIYIWYLIIIMRVFEIVAHRNVDITGQNNWHEVSGCRQPIHKL